MTWNPYLGMEVGMTRLITEKTRNYEYTRFPEVFPPENQKMSIEEMLLGFTINEVFQAGSRSAGSPPYSKAIAEGGLLF